MTPPKGDGGDCHFGWVRSGVVSWARFLILTGPREPATAQPCPHWEGGVNTWLSGELWSGGCT